MNNNINPCPFCNGLEVQVSEDTNGEWAVSCNSSPLCCIWGPTRYTAQEAIDAWNKSTHYKKEMADEINRLLNALA